MLQNSPMACPMEDKLQPQPSQYELMGLGRGQCVALLYYHLGMQRSVQPSLNLESRLLAKPTSGSPIFQWNRGSELALVQQHKERSGLG